MIVALVVSIWTVQILVFVHQVRCNQMTNEALVDLQQASTDLTAAAATISSYITTSTAAFAAIQNSVADTSTQLSQLVAFLENGNSQGWPGLTQTVNSVKAARDALVAAATQANLGLASAQDVATAAAALDTAAQADVTTDVPPPTPPNADNAEPVTEPQAETAVEVPEPVEQNESPESLTGEPSPLTE